MKHRWKGCTLFHAFYRHGGNDSYNLSGGVGFCYQLSELGRRKVSSDKPAISLKHGVKSKKCMATFKDTQILAAGGWVVLKNHDHDLISRVVELKRRKTDKKKKEKPPTQTTNQTANEAPANFLFLIRVLEGTLKPQWKYLGQHRRKS